MRLAADRISSPGASGAVRGFLLSNLFPETRAILLRLYDKQRRVGWQWSANSFHFADIHGTEGIKAHTVFFCYHVFGPQLPLDPQETYTRRLTLLLVDLFPTLSYKDKVVCSLAHIRPLFFLPMMTYSTMERIKVVSHRAKEEHATTITRNMYSLSKRDKQIRHGQTP